MIDKITTERLRLDELTLHHDSFILELVNSPGWIQFIGDRHIHSIDNAQEYIRKIMDNPNVQYWIVTIQDTDYAIGIVTLIKRDYLKHHDIGFAFLPQYEKKGYAYESVKAVLNKLIQDSLHTHILGATTKQNHYSIRLLEKLGLKFEEEILIENETLLLYSLETGLQQSNL
jgi:[ribosomal protein S5]-alanine N-acetyltransferase